LQIFFDDGSAPEVDLSSVQAQGGVFEPLRDPSRFNAVEVGPRGRTLVWRVGEDVVTFAQMRCVLWRTRRRPDQPQPNSGSRPRSTTRSTTTSPPRRTSLAVRVDLATGKADLEHQIDRIVTRVAALTVLFAALHYWSPRG
jgi:hypothetical protein